MRLGLQLPRGETDGVEEEFEGGGLTVGIQLHRAIQHIRFAEIWGRIGLREHIPNPVQHDRVVVNVCGVPMAFEEANNPRAYKPARTGLAG
jgi:hypothetical protein